MSSKNKLITETMAFAREDRLLSWYYFLTTLLLTITAFLGTYWISLSIGKIAFGLLAGLLMCRLFVIYHDFQHKAIFQKSVAAKISMTVFGILVLAPSSIWNETHEHHHHNNSRFCRFVVGSFPTITVRAFRGLSRPQRIKYLVIRHPLMILFAYIPIFLVSFCLWPFFENPKKYTDCGVAVLIHVAISFALYTLGGWSALLFSLRIPSFFTFALGGYIFYAQHNFPEVTLRNDPEWDYLDAALHSSSYIKMNRVLRWFTANIGFHHIHHVNSRIPFYRLPEAMNNLSELQNPRSTSLRPGDVWKCLQLKLWDERQGKLVSMKELKSALKR